MKRLLFLLCTLFLVIGVWWPWYWLVVFGVAGLLSGLAMVLASTGGSK